MTKMDSTSFADQIMWLKKSVLIVLFYVLLISGATAQPVKVAFIGDQGTDVNAQAVLQLVESEGTQLLLIQGDLGYDPDTAAIWEANLDRILGVDFPVLTVVGNHEEYEWPSYKQFITARINRIPELTCTGEIGVKALCQFKGIEIVQVAPGISEVEGVLAEDGYEEYIDQSFATSQAKWRICSWHKNQRKMQVGGKKDETGWGVYQACFRNGGIIATGHEHSYSRTFLMSNFKQQTIVHNNSHMEIDKGQSFAFVSGLGGKSVRPQQLSGAWWAAIQTLDQGATHGALFCEFDQLLASCYFKGINNVSRDSFTLESRLGITPPDPNPSDSTMASIIAIIVTLLFD